MVVAKYGEEFAREIVKLYPVYFCEFSKLSTHKFLSNVEFVVEQISLNEQYQAQH